MDIPNGAGSDLHFLAKRSERAGRRCTGFLKGGVGVKGGWTRLKMPSLAEGPAIKTLKAFPGPKGIIKSGGSSGLGLTLSDQS